MDQFVFTTKGVDGGLDGTPARVIAITESGEMVLEYREGSRMYAAPANVVSISPVEHTINRLTEEEVQFIQNAVMYFAPSGGGGPEFSLYRKIAAQTGVSSQSDKMNEMQNRSIDLQIEAFGGDLRFCISQMKQSFRDRAKAMGITE